VRTDGGRARRGRGRRRGLTAVVLGTTVVGVSACSWFTAFVEQPKLDPWEAVSYPTTTLQPSRGNPQYSVPITGTFVAGFQVSYQPLPGTVDSMSGLKNPTAVSEASLVNGRKLYQINCTPCHGQAGKGDGPVGKYGLPAPSLVADHAKGLADGYIFGIMRNGRGAMPTYDRIEEMDRWDVVNYVRGLQGKLPQAVPTGPVGYPGQTGAALPGASIDAPTRSAPYTAAWMDSARMIRPAQASVPGPAPTAPAVSPAAGGGR
jgi:mono/diheme cytochrome c family protein